MPTTSTAEPDQVLDGLLAALGASLAPAQHHPVARRLVRDTDRLRQALADVAAEAAADQLAAEQAAATERARQANIVADLTPEQQARIAANRARRADR